MFKFYLSKKDTAYAVHQSLLEKRIIGEDMYLIGIYERHNFFGEGEDKKGLRLTSGEELTVPELMELVAKLEEKYKGMENCIVEDYENQRIKMDDLEL